MTDYADFQTPQAHATAIAATGAPLLSLSTVLINTSGTIASALGVVNQPAAGPVTVNQISYEMWLQLVESTNSTKSTAVWVTLNWFDAASGVQVAEDGWWILPGSVNNAHSIMLRGPSKGDQLQVTMTNYGTVNVAYQIVVAQHSRTYDRDRIQSQFFTGFNGFTLASADSTALILDGDHPSVTTTTPVQLVLPIWAGLAMLQCIGSGQPFTVTIISQAQAATGNQNIYQVLVAVNADVNLPVYMPRAQCVLNIANTGSATSSIRVSLIGCES